MKYSEGLWPGQIPTKPKYLAVIFVSLFLTFGCANLQKSQADFMATCLEQGNQIDCVYANYLVAAVSAKKAINNRYLQGAFDEERRDTYKASVDVFTLKAKEAYSVGNIGDIANSRNGLLTLERILRAAQ